MREPADVTDMAAVRDWIKRHPSESVLAGLGVAILLVVIAELVSSEPDASPAITNETTDPTPRAVTNWADEHPALAPVNCTPLITYADIDTVFGVEGQSRDIVEFSQGETCQKRLADDSSYSVVVEPGDPADFSPTAELEGASGTPVAGVGDDAVWFGGDDVGVLTTFKDTEYGGIYFRIRLSRPDTGPDAELELVKALAAAVLPRFPGASEGPAGEPITFDMDPPDPARLGHLENLLEKEADGEWTLGEGLVATLQLMAEERPASQVLRHPDLMEDVVVGVLEIANEYVENGEDDEAKAEVARLLALLSPDPEDLVVAGATDSTAQAFGHHVVAAGFAQEEEPTAGGWCQNRYLIDDPCLQRRPMLEVEARWGRNYELFTLRDPHWEEGPWTDEDLALIEAAVFRTVSIFDQVGSMPRVQILVEPLQASYTYMQGSTCGYHIGVSASSDDGQFSQQIAYSLATCLILHTYGETPWLPGLAVYLGGVAFPGVDREHMEVPTLQAEELSTSLLDRKYTNWSLFEYLHPIVGAKGNFDSAGGLPESISDYFHQYVLALTDAELVDVSSYSSDVEKLVPYKPESSSAQISGPNNYDLTPPPFGLRRVDVQVQSGMHACATIKSSGPVETSRRPGAAGKSSAGWEQLTFPEDTGELKMTLDGDFVIVVTATGRGAMEIEIDDVVEDPDECSEEAKQPGAPAPYDPSCSDCVGTFFYWLEKTYHLTFG